LMLEIAAISSTPEHIPTPEPTVVLFFLKTTNY
jgi:hypothetical protein